MEVLILPIGLHDRVDIYLIVEGNFYAFHVSYLEEMLFTPENFPEEVLGD